MAESAQSTPLYKECIADINNGYRDLLRYYSRGDTRAGYLQTFELCLSQACPGKLLWKFEAYQDQARIFPLPDNPRAYVHSQVFYTYLMTYETIMREIGLLDKDPAQAAQDSILSFSMGDD